MKAITQVLLNQSVRIIPLAVFLILFFHTNAVYSQTAIAYQGGEGVLLDNEWTYTSSGASALALSKVTVIKSSDLKSIVAGGNNSCSSGSNCIGGGSGAGSAVAAWFNFNDVDLSNTSGLNHRVSFNYGNYNLSCNGSGYDAGENVTFTPIYDGIPQSPVTINTGGSDKKIDISSNTYTWDIPDNVIMFSFKISVTLNRCDEFLFLDDVRLTTEPPLPVTLISFHGYAQEQKGILFWSTTMEKDLYGYSIEKSSDGIFFSSIGFKESASTTTVNNYRFDDYNLQHDSYYRLKIMDKNGDVNYSNIIMIEAGEANQALNTELYPNPAGGNVSFILYSETEAEVKIIFRDLLSREHYSIEKNITKGPNNFSEDISSLASGTYIVTVISSTGQTDQLKIQVTAP